MFKATKSAATYRGYKHDFGMVSKTVRKAPRLSIPFDLSGEKSRFNAMRLMLRAGKNRQMYASAFHPLFREDRNAYLCC
jgi:hypothetical protein